MYKIKQYKTVLVMERTVSYERDEVLHGGDVAAIARKIVGSGDREQILAIFLSSQLRPTGCQIVAVGGLDSCATTVKEVIRGAVIKGCAAIALAHNHPSGYATPSESDWVTTQAVAKAVKVCGLILVDHVIVTPGTAFCSLASTFSARWNTMADA